MYVCFAFDNFDANINHGVPVQTRNQGSVSHSQENNKIFAILSETTDTDQIPLMED